MKGLIHQLGMSLRLYYRNTMALIYGYIFPSIFLVAFWVLYRYDQVPLVRHMGELLTIAVLGGACFGLPTTMVSERERGVWRRYRLTPVATGSLVASTVAARYVILLTAGLLQVLLAMAVGMPMPRHPVQLWMAFTFVSFAFLGLGLVIAMLADNVPAVQALGQCIFLPMLIIGGVAVQLASLPTWAQHLSAFFPGRYSVQAIQAAMAGTTLSVARFDLMALVIIGAAGCVAAAMMFRWDAQQRFVTRGGKGWITVALAAWVAVGVLAEARGHVLIASPTSAAGTAMPALRQPAPPSASGQTPAATSTAGATTPTAKPPQPSAPAATTAPTTTATTGKRATAETLPPHVATATPSAKPPASTGHVATPSASAHRTPAAPPPSSAAPSANRQRSAAASGPSSASASSGSAASTPSTPAPPANEAAGPNGYTPPPLPSGATTWQGVTPQDFDLIDFTALPPDAGVVTPIASDTDQPAPDLATQLDTVASRLPSWGPATVADPLQRVRNLLYAAAVTDVEQLPAEPYVPLIVFQQMQQSIPKQDLEKILFWIALHPYQGDKSAVTQLHTIGLRDGPVDPDEMASRVGRYAVKLLGRLTGKRPGG